MQGGTRSATSGSWVLTQRMAVCVFPTPPLAVKTPPVEGTVSLSAKVLTVLPIFFGFLGAHEPTDCENSTTWFNVNPC